MEDNAQTVQSQADVAQISGEHGGLTQLEVFPFWSLLPAEVRDLIIEYWASDENIDENAFIRYSRMWRGSYGEAIRYHGYEAASYKGVFKYLAQNPFEVSEEQIAPIKTGPDGVDVNPFRLDWGILQGYIHGLPDLLSSFTNEERRQAVFGALVGAVFSLARHQAGSHVELGDTNYYEALRLMVCRLGELKNKMHCASYFDLLSNVILDPESKYFLNEGTYRSHLAVELIQASDLLKSQGEDDPDEQMSRLVKISSCLLQKESPTYRDKPLDNISIVNALDARLGVQTLVTLGCDIERELNMRRDLDLFDRRETQKLRREPVDQEKLETLVNTVLDKEINMDDQRALLKRISSINKLSKIGLFRIEDEGGRKKIFDAGIEAFNMLMKQAGDGGLRSRLPGGGIASIKDHEFRVKVQKAASEFRHALVGWAPKDFKERFDDYTKVLSDLASYVVLDMQLAIRLMEHLKELTVAERPQYFRGLCKLAFGDKLERLDSATKELGGWKRSMGFWFSVGLRLLDPGSRLEIAEELRDHAKGMKKVWSKIRATHFIGVWCTHTLEFPHQISFATSLLNGKRVIEHAKAEKTLRLLRIEKPPKQTDALVKFKGMR
jgi:hypothetical protein